MWLLEHELASDRRQTLMIGSLVVVECLVRKRIIELRTLVRIVVVVSNTCERQVLACVLDLDSDLIVGASTGHDHDVPVINFGDTVALIAQ